MGIGEVLDSMLGNKRWARVEADPGTAKQHAKRVTALGALAGSPLSGLSVDAKDEKEDRTTVLSVGSTQIIVEAEKEDGIGDDVLEGLNGALKAAGAGVRFAWAHRDEGAVACLTSDEAEKLRKAGLPVEELGDGDEGEGDGALGGWRRPTRADVPGAAEGSPVKVEGKMDVGPVTSGGAVEVTFDAAGNVDQIRAKKGPLTVNAKFAGTNVAILLKGRAECKATGWRAWGELAKDLTLGDTQIHAGDEIDIADGHVEGVVLVAAGTVFGKARKAGAVVDIPRK
jgi:hypothetical protein